MTSSKLQAVFRLIDEANAQDPNSATDDDQARPAELVYGERMTATLNAFNPDAGDMLQIAARGQHIERWTSPRKSYPEGKAGYMRWRNDLKRYHARRLGELMQQAGYDAPEIERVATLISKRAIKRDSDAQCLEDVICLTFLEHYAADFIAPYDDDKVIDILAKTARKMSPEGLAAAGAIDLPERLGTLLGKALAGD